MNCDWYEYRWQKGISRYYKVFLYKDLLGDWILTKVWGGVNSRLGNYEHKLYPTMQAASSMINQIKVQRKKRGYHLKRIK